MMQQKMHWYKLHRACNGEREQKVGMATSLVYRESFCSRGYVRLGAPRKECIVKNSNLSRQEVRYRRNRNHRGCGITHRIKRV